jgi:hypothetical protein
VPKPPASAGSDLLVVFGGTVRAVGNGKFEAPLVTFTSVREPDLYNTYFDARTDYWIDFPGRLPQIYNHGLDPQLGRRKLGLETPARGFCEVEKRNAGVWMQGQLDMRDEYERMIYEMIQAGKMGTSSGSCAHLVDSEEEPGTDGVHRMTSWPLVEGSLTPTPAEPRNRVQPVRALRSLPPLWKLAAGVGGSSSGRAGSGRPSRAVHRTSDPELQRIRAQAEARYWAGEASRRTTSDPEIRRIRADVEARQRRIDRLWAQAR